MRLEQPNSTESENNSITLDQVRRYLESLNRPLGLAQLRALMESIDVHSEDIADFVKFDEEVYCRNRILKTEHAELTLMCWRSGQLTPIHDHAGSGCGIRILSGRATEITFINSASGHLIPDKTTNLNPGELSVSFDTDIHQMGNLERAGEDLVTLHCYSPPLTGMSLFEGSTTFFGGYDQMYSTVTKRLKKTK